MELLTVIKREEVIFRIIAALTAGFFWLSIMRFLNSYDEHMDIQADMVRAITEIHNRQAATRKYYEGRIDDLYKRVRALEAKAGIQSQEIELIEIEI